MKSLLSRLFALNPGEESKIFKLAFLGLLWSFVATIGLKYADALFLTHVGAGMLPSVYQWVSVGLILLSFVLLSVFNRLSSYLVFKYVLITGIIFYALAHLCAFSEFGANADWPWYIFRIFGNLFLTVLITCYWTFIDQYLHRNDAKRLFGLFSSTVFIGMILTGLVMKYALLSITSIFPVLIIILLFALYWMRTIHNNMAPDHEEIVQLSENSAPQTSIFTIIKAILSSRYAILLIICNFLTFILWVIAEFNYMSAFNEKYSTVEQQVELTEFLGHWVMMIAIFNLIFGLFIYGRLVKRYGIGTILLYTPFLFFITFAGWLLHSSMVFPMMGFFIVEGALYIVDDSNFSLLIKSGPTTLKSKLRVLIESFFEPAGMLASGWLLSFPELNSKLIGLGLAICLLIVALTMKALYFPSKEKALAPTNS